MGGCEGAEDAEGDVGCESVDGEGGKGGGLADVVKC